METPTPIPELKGEINVKTERDKESLMDRAMIDFASMLDDFLDEEVVDKHGAAIGTLACYWKSVSGRLIFLGINVRGQKNIRVVPGSPSQLDDRDSCIRLGFEAEDIESAPHADCDDEMDANIERSVYKHFGDDEAHLHGEPGYFARPS